MRQNWLSNRIFKSFDDSVDRCCYSLSLIWKSPESHAWNTLIDQPCKIRHSAGWYKSPPELTGPPPNRGWRWTWAIAGHSL
jgi:hypothetical protein